MEWGGAKRGCDGRCLKNRSKKKGYVKTCDPLVDTTPNEHVREQRCWGHITAKRAMARAPHAHSTGG